MGPAIAPARYQVGSDVRQAIARAFGPAADALIRQDPSDPDRWLLDLPAANRLALRHAGVPAPRIHVTPLPTGPATPTGYFFSDRAARPCGRHALVARLRGKAGHPFQGSEEDFADHAVADE